MSDHDGAQPDPFAVPPMPAPPVSPPPPPNALVVAGTLWITLGVLLTLAYGLGALRYLGLGYVPGAVAAIALTAIGAVVWKLGIGVRRGDDYRVALVVLGVLNSISLIPLVLVVPAVILQYHSSSRHWFSRGPS